MNNRLGSIFDEDGLIYKICALCHVKKQATNEHYYISVSGKIHSYCKPCNDKLTLNKQRESKAKCIIYKGGKCSNCGYDRYQGSLHFHHLDPKTKSFNLTKNLTYNWDKLKTELDKCILLCANCHREQHSKIQ